MSVQRVTVAPGHWLAPGPAAALTAAIAAGMPVEITDAGRTTAEQAALYRRFLRGEIVSAAPPGSPIAYHEKGEAVDLGPAASAWLARRPEYGFRRTLNPPEWWHFQWFRSLATYQEDDMPSPIDVWKVPVQRAGKAVPVIQELADTKTLALQLTRQVAGLTAAVETLATAVANGDDLTAEALRAAVRDGLSDALADVETTITIRTQEEST